MLNVHSKEIIILHFSQMKNHYLKIMKVENSLETLIQNSKEMKKALLYKIKIQISLTILIVYLTSTKIVK